MDEDDGIITEDIVGSTKTKFLAEEFFVFLNGSGDEADFEYVLFFKID